MTWLVPSALAIAGVAAAITIALHFIARSTPLAEPLPTTRFIPAAAVHARSRSVALTDLLLLLVRIAALLAIGLAIAAPSITGRGRVTRIVLLDRSRAVADLAESRDSLRALSGASTMIAFDSAATGGMTSLNPAAITASTARGSLSAALARAIGSAATLSRATDSVALVLVSPFAAEEIDDATMRIRAAWPGRIRVIPVRATPPLPSLPRVTVRGEANDAVAAGLALMGRTGTDGSVRVVRGSLTADDSVWAMSNGHVLVHWPASAAFADWPSRSTIDAVGGVTSSTGTIVARFPRVWVLQGRAIARWSDGTEAAVERATGGGCIRHVGILIDEASDLTLRQPFRAFATALIAPCGGTRRSMRISDATLAAIAGSGGLAPSSALRDRAAEMSRWTPWLFLLGALILIGELALRRSMPPLTVNTFARLRIVRSILAAGVALRALSWGLVIASTLLIGVALADLIVPLPLSVREPVRAVVLLAALAAAVAFAWRDRAVLSLIHVALWIEERFPSIEYALVTAVETGQQPSIPLLAPQWVATARRRVLRALGAPLVALAVVIVVILAMPRGAMARVRRPHPGDALDRPRLASPASSRLAPLVAIVLPPAYSGEKAQTIDEPTDVRALVGSVVTLQGRGDDGAIAARIAGDSSRGNGPAVTSKGDRWQISFRVPAHSVALELSDRQFRRVVAVEAVPDNPPQVTLVTPARDSVLRVARGRIALTADVSDDYGISTASFEYIISSGEGETFTFRSGTIGAVKPEARRTSLSASLSIDALSLKPGDVVHLRAVAHDGNTIGGPGLGVSETRSIRIARTDEYDSVAVDAAGPSDADKSMISERMLITLTEALDGKRRALPRDTLIAESHAIAVDQQQLRRTVGELVFTRLGGDPSGEEHEGDDNPARARTMQELLARADAATNRSSDPIDFGGGESPVVAVNQPLLEAYNAMWDASTSLEIGETSAALPHMRLALAAIQRARQAERIYLRGAPPPIIVDVDKVRLVGKDKGESSAHAGVPPIDSAARDRANRFERIVELAARQPQAAVDSLLLLRIETLGENADFAAALRDAAAAMRAGRANDATSALMRARRALAGPPVVRDSLSRWGGLP